MRGAVDDRPAAACAVMRLLVVATTELKLTGAPALLACCWWAANCLAAAAAAATAGGKSPLIIRPGFGMPVKLLIGGGLEKASLLTGRGWNTELLGEFGLIVAGWIEPKQTTEDVNFKV